MVDPSPDWFLGVSGLELCVENCSWVESRTLELYPWDAGTGISKKKCFSKLILFLANPRNEQIRDQRITLQMNRPALVNKYVASEQITRMIDDLHFMIPVRT